MNIGTFFRTVSLSFALVTMSWASEKSGQPENRYLRGVEDRLAQADAVVVGQTKIMEETSVGTSSRKQVRARIHVTSVLKGGLALKEIDYTSAYSPEGYTSFSGNRYWDSDDELHSRLVECFPYAVQPSAIFFLKRDRDSAWTPFYAYLEDEKQTIAPAIKSIITAEQQLSEQEPTEIIIPLLQAENPPLLQKYAVRAIVRHLETWSQRTNALQMVADQLGKDEALYSYALTCIVAQLRNERSMSGANSGLGLVIVLIEKAPSVTALDAAVRQAGIISRVFLANPEKAKALRQALLDKRRSLTGRQSQSPVLTPGDKALLANIGQPVPE